MSSFPLWSCSESVQTVAHPFKLNAVLFNLKPKNDLEQPVGVKDSGSPSDGRVYVKISSPNCDSADHDDVVADDEKWRTDRFFLGTQLYVTINPRALTEKCASGSCCPFHPFCDFAHESSELRERPLTQMWNFKTKLCDKFHSLTACCPYGNRWYAFFNTRPDFALINSKNRLILCGSSYLHYIPLGHTIFVPHIFASHSFSLMLVSRCRGDRTYVVFHHWDGYQTRKQSFATQQTQIVHSARASRGSFATGRFVSLERIFSDAS